MRYRAEPPPRGATSDQIAEYLERELSRISQALSNPDPLWEDYRVTLASAKPGATNPPGFEKLKDNGAGSTGVFAWHFSATALEEVFFEVQLPHAFVQFRGTIEPHIHWCPTTTNTGVVRWGLEFTGANFGDVIGNSSIIYAQEAGLGTAYRHQIAKWSGIDARTFAISRVFSCRLFRDAANAADTYSADAAALSFDFHLQVDALGSEVEYTKRREGPV
ncbi:MAG: hypothetical protein MUE59_06160 [Thiobacillaceae bacterium]|jgi:hypothetical protein|nr:hypothetical protein [Thiobacillaceae bacterium]